MGHERRTARPAARRVVGAGVAVLLCGFQVATLAGSARADGSGPSYSAFAKATSLDATLSNQSIPLGIVVEGIGPEADANQSSLGFGLANTYFPYLGDELPGVFGIASSALGVPTPTYPLFASASTGQDPSTVSYPGITLHAESGASSTVAEATAGASASGATTTARIDIDANGGVTSTANSTARALALGTVLSLSGVESQATVSADPDTGVLTRTQSASIGHITVPGLSIVLPKTTPGQVPVPIPIPGIPNIPPLNLPTVPIPFGGQVITTPDIGITNGTFTISLPFLGKTQAFALPAQTVLDALKAAGITMRFEAPQDLTDGEQSGAYTFSYTSPAPPSNPLFSGPATITYSTGTSTATVDLHPVSTPGTSAGSSTVVAPTAAAPSTGSVAQPATSLPLPPAGSGGGSDLGSGPDGLISTGPVTGPSSPVLAAGPPEQTGGLAPAAALAPVQTRGSNIYLAFVVAAGVALVAGIGVRLIGVRSAWAS